MTVFRRRPSPRSGLVPIDRALSKLGLASRADARRLLREGRVRVNGRPVLHVGVRVSLDDRIVIAGEPARARLQPPARVVIALHKPRGVVTSTRDPEGRRTVFDVLREAGLSEDDGDDANDGWPGRLHAVGRLDWASSGLLLFTNDAQLLNALTDPNRGVEREYAVTVRGRVMPEDVAALRHDGAAVDVRKASARETHLLVTLRQGKNREIRNMFGAIGHEVTRLHRVRYGPASLGELQPGQWTDVTAAFDRFS